MSYYFSFFINHTNLFQHSSEVQSFNRVMNYIKMTSKLFDVTSSLDEKGNRLK